MPGRKHRLAVVTGAALLVSALAMPAAHAETDDTSVTITAGDLTLSPILVGDFAARTVTGTIQTTPASMDDYSVTDLRGGLGGGWHLTAEATQFDSGTATLPANSLLMAPPVVTAGTDNLAVPPVVIPTPHLLDSGAPSTVANALAGTGTGHWDFTNAADSFVLTLPGAVAPGTYTSTVTMTLTAGPSL